MIITTAPKNTVPTFDAGIAGLKVWDEVALARVKVNQRSDADLTRDLGRAEAVQIRLDVLGTADVEVSAYTSTGSHPTELGRSDEDHWSTVAGRVERFVQTEVGDF